MCRLLAGEAISAAFVELYGFSLNDTASQHENNRALKKQKVISTSSDSSSSLEPALSGSSAEELSAQISVMELLETILASAGPMMVPGQRAQYDSVAAHMAICINDAATEFSRDPSTSLERVSGLDGLRLTSLKLLLTSVSTPLSHRPPYFNQVI